MAFVLNIKRSRLNLFEVFAKLAPEGTQSKAVWKGFFSFVHSELLNLEEKLPPGSICTNIRTQGNFLSKDCELPTFIHIELGFEDR